MSDTTTAPAATPAPKAAAPVAPAPVAPAPVAKTPAPAPAPVVDSDSLHVEVADVRTEIAAHVLASIYAHQGVLTNAAQAVRKAIEATDLLLEELNS